MQSFKKTLKQIQAIDLITAFKYIMLYGGSRSGKTFILIYVIFVRALKCRSRHLIVRFRFNHAKASLWHDTIPKVAKLLGITYHENKQDWFIEFPNGSQIWIGGIDDKDRVEKILGNEYSTIYCNESSQISYPAVEMLMTRLAEKTALKNRFLFDCNPPSKKHWTYILFVLGLNPNDKTAMGSGYGWLKMNPQDNEENIAEGYIEDVLMRMSKRQQERFLLGEFLNDVEGALWNFDMVNAAKLLSIGDGIKTVVGVDPAVTSDENSDLTGIIVASAVDKDTARIDADYSMKASPLQWAQASINAYYKHDAAYIVAEVNQGGDLVKTVINQIDPKIKVVTVHANKGKFARAEPVAALYEQNKIAHAEGLEDLETEMMEYVPMVSKKSPDRLDAMVYAVTDLLLKQTPEPMLRIL